VPLSLMKRFEDASKEFESRSASIPTCSTRITTTRERSSCAERRRLGHVLRKAADVRKILKPVSLAQSLGMMGRDNEASISGGDSSRGAHARAQSTDSARCRSALYLLEEGDAERAVEWSERALELYPDDMSSLGNGACLQAKLGHTDRAIELLERVSALGWGQRDWLERDPDYDNLRDDPRFQRLVTTFK
jgi:tetratricopeptide (TPR) repeat protein